MYGDHQLDLLRDSGALPLIRKTIRTGNYRLPYYLAHQARFDQLAEESVFKQFDQQRPTILYAPSWNDGENASSFAVLTETLIRELSDSFNLLIKLHPLLAEDSPALFYSLLSRYEGNRRVQFLVEFPPIYPLLAKCDLYLGDHSSIGYDFLAFDKPLFYFSTQNHSPLSSVASPFYWKESKKSKI